jgi:hypothetical protein
MTHVEDNGVVATRHVLGNGPTGVLKGHEPTSEGNDFRT